jgi:uncharacterized membrane protein YvbJ
MECRPSGLPYDDMQCRQCGTEIADKALICYRCGTATTEARYKPVPIHGRRPRSTVIGYALALLVVLLLILYFILAG